MTSEWDDTPWGGTVAAPSQITVAKAATGWEQFAYSGAVPISTLSRSPLKRMREEQALFWSHPWVRVAETTVTRKVAGLPWHIEDGASDEEIEDDTPDPRLKAVRDLLDKPQAALPPRERQPGIDTWSNLVKITSRHLGLCGLSHWYPDQPDANGVPAAIMYVNPARMFPMTTTSGHLVGWKLDPTDDYGNGGTVLMREEVLTFYLDPPDAGGLATGLVHAAWLKTQITQHGDSHFLDTLASGGRLAGIITPKTGTLNDDEFAVANRELRNAQEAPDASKRLTIVRGPVEYHRTTGNSQELDLSGYAGMTRSDILTIWGVPDSQAAVPIAGGLNSGSTKEADEPVLMQGAVHDRVMVLAPTIQGLLDRWVGIRPQLVIEEPQFDDETPAYTLAATAKDQPLTRNERRAIIHLDPLPEYGPDGEPLGLAIDLPMMLSTVGQGEEAERAQPEGRFGRAPKTPEITVTAPPPPLQIPATLPEPAKAGPLGSRDAIVRRFEPALRRSVAGFLQEQGTELAAKVRERGDHLARKPSDKAVWWDQKRWDAKLLAAVKQGLAGLAANVITKVTANLGPAPAKADPFTTSVLEAILRTIGVRIAGINQTTRDAIAALIGQGFDDGLSPAQIADLIGEATSFDEERAELIARTETAQVYNEAALRSYEEYGVTEVEAIDGDEDEECATRNGTVYALEEALSIEDHPNGTLDWLPVLAPAKAEPQRVRVMRTDDGWVLEAIT